MHLGNFIKDEINKQRYELKEIASMVNKSYTAVRKDLMKETLHQSAIDAYSKILKINIYELLAAEMSSKNYNIPSLPRQDEVSEPPVEKISKKQAGSLETVSVTFQIPATKKEALLKLLTS